VFLCPVVDSAGVMSHTTRKRPISMADFEKKDNPRVSKSAKTTQQHKKQSKKEQQITRPESKMQGKEKSKEREGKKKKLEEAQKRKQKGKAKQKEMRQGKEGKIKRAPSAKEKKKEKKVAARIRKENIRRRRKLYVNPFVRELSAAANSTWEDMVDDEENDVAESGLSVTFILLQFIDAYEGDKDKWAMDYKDAFPKVTALAALQACLYYFLDYPNVVDTYF